MPAHLLDRPTGDVSLAQVARGEGMPDALVALDTRPEQCLVPRHMGLERQRAALLPSGLDSDTGEA